MQKKEKKILNTLMGFYQLAASLYEGLAVIPDKNMQGLVLKEHLYVLLKFHKEFVDKYKVGFPKLDDTFDNYCKEYADKVSQLTEKYNEMLAQQPQCQEECIKDDKEASYYS